MGSKSSKSKKSKAVEKPTKSKKKYNSDLDIDCAKDLVRLCLSKDKIYNKYLDSIMKLDDPQFENLFKGKVDAKYDIDSFEFSQLVHKFEDYRKILYNFYTDQKKHEDIAKLWKNDVNIFNLYDLSSAELNKSLEDYDLSFQFKDELISLLSKTLESQSDNIIIYLKDKALFLFEFYNFSKAEERKLKNKEKDDCKLYSSNICNMLGSLIIKVLPFVKGYLSNIPNLEPVSKKELKDSKINEVIKNMILKAFKNKEGDPKLKKHF